MSSSTASSTSAESRERRKVILASSLGTMFEWYDFYLYGSLSTVIAKQFFSGVNPTASFIFALLAFAAGFVVRPFGSLLFGRLGDMSGRKHTFLITIVLMGLPTFIVGLLPSYASVGIAAPIMLIALRLLQGLAVGGEYGGAVTYVAEYSTPSVRGFNTSWIQTTGSGGLLLSLFVILGVRTLIGEAQFMAWGWRVPFLFSIALLGVSMWIRLKLKESPEFEKMQQKGAQSKAPLRDTFGNRRNAMMVLFSLLGCTAGLGVVAYTSQFYIQFFLLQTLKVDGRIANEVLALSLVIGLPFYVFFGWLSDRIGRKPVILTGCLLAALTYFPIYKSIAHYANPQLEHARAAAPVELHATPESCSVQFNPVGTAAFTTSCDSAKAVLARSSVPYTTVVQPAGAPASIHIGGQVIPAVDGAKLSEADFATQSSALNTRVTQALAASGYPITAVSADVNRPMLILLMTVLIIYLTMVYSPAAAWLVELFPPQVRYTATSLPYNIGNGWFGGFMPATAFAMVAATGDIFYGLWYPVVVASCTFIIGLFFLPETRFNSGAEVPSAHARSRAVSNSAG
ncbi:major facilitator transporter [Pandoraea terrae]|uniref:Major facilitator transporter n=1 Tax=Pandoraea terrae TaxID=1537710 RepID=A0A5E4RDR5_9BURK|nr:MFS transporter [Pandoraea terrae]VVD61430.1 major facilitator transporter [Pandoraea terrae]